MVSTADLPQDCSPWSGHSPHYPTLVNLELLAAPLAAALTFDAGEPSAKALSRLLAAPQLFPGPVPVSAGAPNAGSAPATQGTCFTP